MRKPRVKYWFKVYLGASIHGVMVLANTPAHAVSKFVKLIRKQTSLCPDYETGGWKRLSVEVKQHVEFAE